MLMEKRGFLGLTFLDLTESKVYSLMQKERTGSLAPNQERVRFLGYLVEIDATKNTEEKAKEFEQARLRFIEALDNTLLLSMYARASVDPFGTGNMKWCEEARNERSKAFVVPHPVPHLHQFAEAGTPERTFAEKDLHLKTEKVTINVDFTQFKLYVLSPPFCMPLAQIGTNERYMFITYLSIGGW